MDGGVREIPLTQGKVALVDAEDFVWLSAFEWTFNGRYATRAALPGEKSYCPMHRELIDVPKGMVPDHINGDGLDNRKANLRAATLSQNARNVRPLAPVATGYRGVHDGGPGFWAVLKVDGKRVQRGPYPTAREAAVIRDAMARQHHGEFATLNFPTGETSAREPFDIYPDLIAGRAPAAPPEPPAAARARELFLAAREAVSAYAKASGCPHQVDPFLWVASRNPTLNVVSRQMGEA